MKKVFLVVVSLVGCGSAIADSCPPSMLEVCDYTRGTFYHLDNQLGFNVLGVYDQATLTNSQQSVSAGGLGAEAYWDFLTTNSFWFSNKVDYVTYLGASDFATDQANYTFKFGYGFQPIYDYWQITPYVVGSVGAGQENWDSNVNFGAGVGLRTQVALVTRNSIYADYNVQYLMANGNFSDAYNQQFGTDNAFLNGKPYVQNFELGYKHVFSCNLNMQAFYRYTNNNMNFSFGGTAPDQAYNNAINMIGIGLSWYMGGS